VTINHVAGIVNAVTFNGSLNGNASSATNITQYTINQNLGTGNQVTFDTVVTGNNGNGTNYRIGDDCWIGDINIANTFRVQGVQNANAGYICFGNGDTVALGRTGTGALTYGGNTIYHSANIPTWNQSTSGNAATSTSFSTDRTNYRSYTSAAVAGELMWKNYGNGHTIIDASNSTAPNGTTISNSDSAVAWSGSYPMLVGWNGSSTYGVKVDRSRYSESTGYADWSGVGNKPANLFSYGAAGWAIDANWMAGNSSGFTYAVGAPWSGAVARFYAGGYDLQLNSDYGGSNHLSWRSYNGDVGSWNPWREIVHSGNIASQNVDSVDGQHFAWSNNSNSPAYLWAADSNGSAYLCARGSMSVNFATSATNATNPTVNYNNDSNSTYQMVWGSGNAIYGTGGIYCNPYLDRLYATDFEANGAGSAGGFILHDTGGQRYRIYVSGGQLYVASI
jgi:hypothetical protein